VIDLALGGDTTCLRMCLDRIVPVGHGPGITLELPKLTRDPKSVAAAHAAVLAAETTGAFSTEQGEALTRLIEKAHVAAVEVPMPRTSEQAAIDQHLADLLNQAAGLPPLVRATKGTKPIK